MDSVFFTGLAELIISCISHTHVRDDNAVKAQAEQKERLGTVSHEQEKQRQRLK